MQPRSEPRRERRFTVQVLAQVDIDAADRVEAREMALAELAHRCEHDRRALLVHVEEER